MNFSVENPTNITYINTFAYTVPGMLSHGSPVFEVIIRRSGILESLKKGADAWNWEIKMRGYYFEEDNNSSRLWSMEIFEAAHKHAREFIQRHIDENFEWFDREFEAEMQRKERESQEALRKREARIAADPAPEAGLVKAMIKNAINDLRNDAELGRLSVYTIAGRRRGSDVEHYFELKLRDGKARFCAEMNDTVSRKYVTEFLEAGSAEYMSFEKTVISERNADGVNVIKLGA